MEIGYSKQKPEISPKRFKIERELLLITDYKVIYKLSIASKIDDPE